MRVAVCVLPTCSFQDFGQMTVYLDAGLPCEEKCGNGGLESRVFGNVCMAQNFFGYDRNPVHTTSVQLCVSFDRILSSVNITALLHYQKSWKKPSGTKIVKIAKLCCKLFSLFVRF